MRFITGTAKRLDAAKAALLETQDKIADLIRRRQEALLADDTDAVLAIDDQHAMARRRVGLWQDKIAALQEKLMAEQDEKRQKDYHAAVDKIASRIAGLAAHDTELASAMKAVATALEKKAAAQRDLLKDWPTAAGRPLVSQIGLVNAEAALADSFAVFDRNKFGRFPDWNLERRLDHVRRVASNFKADEQRNFEELLSDLRNSGPKPAEAESEAA